MRDTAPPADLQSQVSAREKLVVLLPRRHRLATVGAVALQDLAEEPFITVRTVAGYSYLTRIVDLCREAGFTPRVVQETGEWSTVAGLVSAGLGIALAPTSVARISLSGMACRPLARKAASDILMFWRDDAGNAAVRNFIALARTAGKPHRQAPTPPGIAEDAGASA